MEDYEKRTLWRILPSFENTWDAPRITANSAEAERFRKDRHYIVETSRENHLPKETIQEDPPKKYTAPVINIFSSLKKKLHSCIGCVCSCGGRPCNPDDEDRK